MAKEKFFPPDPAESMRLIGGTQEQIDDLKRQLDKLKTRTGEVKAALKGLEEKKDATIRGELEENLFSKIPAETATPVNPAGAAKPPGNWKAHKLADLPGLSEKDKAQLADVPVDNVGSWAEMTKGDNRTPPGKLTKAGFDRVEKAVRVFMTGSAPAKE